MFRTLALGSALCALLAAQPVLAEPAAPIDDLITSAISPDAAAPLAGRSLVLAEITYPDPAHPANRALRAAVDTGAISGVFIGDLGLGSRERFEGLVRLFSSPSPTGTTPILGLKLSRSAAEALVDLYVPRAEQTAADLPRIMAQAGIRIDLSVPVDWHRLREGGVDAATEADVVMAASSAIGIRDAYGIRSVLAMPGVLSSPRTPDGVAAAMEIEHHKAAEVLDGLSRRGAAALLVTGGARAGGNAFLSAVIGWRGAVGYALGCDGGRDIDPAIASDSIVLLEGDACADPARLAAMARDLGDPARATRGMPRKVERLVASLGAVPNATLLSPRPAAPAERRRMR